MSVKSDTLRLLEESRGKRLSGEDIAGRLGVTRAAVWKAVKSLTGEGYDIDGHSGFGYMLGESSDILSSEGVYVALNNLQKKQDKYTDNINVIVYDSIDSTNEEIKRRAVAGAGAGLVVISDEQTAGKGRRGRSFFSPKGSGLYISMLFKPSGMNSEDIVLITTQAAVAVSLAIESVYGKKTQIKWVNDVYIGDKKICGILTEAISDFESGGIDMVMVGIGINVREPEQVPDDLKNIIGYIIDNTDDTYVGNNIIENNIINNKNNPTRNMLAAAIIDNLYGFYDALPDRGFMHEYRVRSNVLGEQVIYTRGYSPDTEEATLAKAVGIDDDGGLIVRLPDGHEEVLHTGEVTLRIVHTHSSSGSLIG